MLNNYYNFTNIYFNYFKYFERIICKNKTKYLKNECITISHKNIVV